MVNRSDLTIKAKEPFVEWLKSRPEIPYRYINKYFVSIPNLRFSRIAYHTPYSARYDLES